ncbi:MAG TPA: hypothetical protein VFP98_09520, partial [Candidatus Polarisedimenticolia bacterium]|nr:hypothetical protein [Candidatus Polarisedimenticolia bacterium]
MRINYGKAALAAALLTLTPAAAVLSGSASDARADTYVSGSITIGSPVAVLGFSYGDPFVIGHVHYSPVYCSHGPLYYYPQHRVYTHYYPRYRYAYYSAPILRHRHSHYAHHVRVGHGFRWAAPGHRHSYERGGYRTVRGHDRGGYDR